MTDLEIIRQIEKKLDVKLNKLDKIEWDSKGYTLNQEGQVTGLGLYECKIENLNRIISALSALTNLTQLYFNSNQVSDISTLSALTNLTQLNFRSNHVSDISPLSALTNLTQLYFNSNQVSDISPLSALANLTQLYFNSNQVSDISSLSALINLTQLYFRSNQVSDISTLSALTNLTKLNFRSNQVSDISPLSALTNLTKLNFRSNQVSDISSLSNLANLTQLDFSSNQVSDISPLFALMNLTQLYLRSNQVSDIFSLSALTNLTQLSFSFNQVSDILPLSTLTNLTQLSFRSNQASDISALSTLTNLMRLSFSSNQVSNISQLINLKNLNMLQLQKNPIEVLPSWITDFDMEIQWKESEYNNGYISFYDNPLKTPPPEIVKQGKAAVKNYFEQLKAQEEDYLFEAKMLIIGEPGAGKTTMARKMEDACCDLPKPDETTKGIDVKQYYFPLQKEDFKAFRHPEKLENKKFRLNLWDFGGQEIYKATHRFFLSKRCLYALVADSRNENTDFNYWLHIVEMFGGDSPLLIVLNEKDQRKRNLDIAVMKNRFGNISEAIDLDFAEKDKTRLNRLERAVRYYVSQLSHIGSPVPSKWTKIREVLENDTRNTISLQDYLKICQDNTISKLEDARVLSQYFHDIGVFLHFQDDELLEKTVFLKPDWATHAVYKILDDPLLNRQDGRFSKNDAKNIWHEDEYSLLRSELLRLMQKFFLTYEIGNSGEYIVPEKLPSATPDYSWNEKDNLFFRYKYDYFMPKGIMSQFIVQMHRYICNHNLVWRLGVILERENTTAEIVESYDSRVISIRISGKNRRDFMTIITEQVDKINAQYEKMKPEKLIPCNCGECRISGKPYFYQYRDLKRRIEKGRREVECGESFKMVNVRSLIDEVINESMQGRNEEENICKPQKIKRDTVFISYCQKDGKLLKRVHTHLKVLESLGITINVWDDTKIKAGQKWFKEIESALSAAKVAILLVSTDFLASDFIRTNELPPLLKAAENDGATILPLILDDCMFEDREELSQFQAVNKPSEALSDLPRNKKEKVLLNLAKRVKELIQPAKKETAQ
jgi:Leucine-rich repeat (LRR) protein/GTPase SAR1 family protein